MKNKNEEIIREYLKGKTVLLATDSSTDKVAWKKLLHDMGLEMPHFSDANSLAEALAIIQEKTINIVFMSHIIGGENMMSLVDKHIEKHTDRNAFSCLMVTEKSSLAISAYAAEHDVDSLIVKPYNQADLIKSISNMILEAVNRSKELVLYHQTISSLRLGELDNASKQIDEYLALKPESGNTFFLNGLLHFKQDNFEDAINIWESGLEHSPDHHQILCHLFDTLIMEKEFTRAYPYAVTLSDKFPINPERIPDFIRVSLAMGAYHDLINFCEMILELDEDLSSIDKPIAAALAVSAKSLVDEDSDIKLIKETTLRAMDLTDSSSEIFATCIESLYRVECFKEVTEAINKIPSDGLSPRLVDIELLIEERVGSVDLAYAKAQGLVKLKKTSEHVYFVLIRTGLKLGKSNQHLEDIIYEAAKSFPHIKQDLLSLMDL